MNTNYKIILKNTDSGELIFLADNVNDNVKINTVKTLLKDIDFSETNQSKIPLDPDIGCIDTLCKHLESNGVSINYENIIKKNELFDIDIVDYIDTGIFKTILI